LELGNGIAESIATLRIVVVKGNKKLHTDATFPRQSA